MSAGAEDREFLGSLIRAQFGSNPEFIDEHMKDYFKRWPSYEKRLTSLERYHLFNDVIEAYEKYKLNKNHYGNRTRNAQKRTR